MNLPGPAGYIHTPGLYPSSDNVAVSPSDYPILTTCVWNVNREDLANEDEREASNFTLRSDVAAGFDEEDTFIIYDVSVFL